MSFYRYCARCGAGINSDTPKEFYKWDKLRRVAPKVYEAIDEFFSEEVIRGEKVNKERKEWVNRVEKLELTLIMSVRDIGILATKLSEVIQFIPEDDLFSYNTACNTLDAAKKRIEYIKSCDFMHVRTGGHINNRIDINLPKEWPTPTRREK